MFKHHSLYTHSILSYVVITDIEEEIFYIEISCIPHFGAQKLKHINNIKDDFKSYTVCHYVPYYRPQIDYLTHYP